MDECKPLPAISAASVTASPQLTACQIARHVKGWHLTYQTRVGECVGGRVECSCQSLPEVNCVSCSWSRAVCSAMRPGPRAPGAENIPPKQPGVVATSVPCGLGAVRERLVGVAAEASRTATVEAPSPSVLGCCCCATAADIFSSAASKAWRGGNSSL